MQWDEKSARQYAETPNCSFIWSYHLLWFIYWSMTLYHPLTLCCICAFVTLTNALVYWYVFVVHFFVHVLADFYILIICMFACFYHLFAYMLPFICLFFNCFTVYIFFYCSSNHCLLLILIGVHSQSHTYVQFRIT